MADNLSTRDLLGGLNKDRLVELGRLFTLPIPPAGKKTEQIDAVSGHVPFKDLLRAFTRDELKAACKAHGLDASGRARSQLAGRLVKAHGDGTGTGVQPIFGDTSGPRIRPEVGDVVQVRHRQYLAEEVVLPPEPGHATRIKLVCLDDDNQGREIEILWELELGARVLQPEAHGLGRIEGIDPPRFFAAYLHALKWNSVTATDAKLFQSPFRAGIKLMNHQLTPLKKALELPRANLFIADDVGLGKTIEAGLVLQELYLRQRVEFALIVCPASVALQWRDEMAKRFGLNFEIVNRAFVARRRQERGFGVNPWATHTRFVISYQTLRRPEYLEPLTQHLGPRFKKSMLILDEAHTVAPASASKYAIDSRITKMTRQDLTPRFENRLFLSATPHNGHSNSFSALLELLDPQRFTRGMPINPDALRPVMIRRLKSDLKELGTDKFPSRQVVKVELVHQAKAWKASYHRTEDRKPLAASPEDQARKLGAGSPAEVELSELLAEYTELMRPKKGRGQLVFISLQKRLLSSVEAFHMTLKRHAKGVLEGRSQTALRIKHSRADDEDEYGTDDEQRDEAEGVEIERDSGGIQSPEGRAKELLDQMLRLSEQHRGAPDGKVLALLDWIRQHQCPGVEVGGASSSKKSDLAWTDRRVIVFTEYGDTKRYIYQQLQAAVQDTLQAEERLMHFHGGMSDQQREEVQRSFNGSPAEYPVRILVATDAAREGVNLQGHCADLFHFDVPWNPARMEQRNGRIDRTLQPAPVVRCHYFTYAQRPTDVVFEKIVEKVATIQHELGSLGAVVMDRMGEALERGLTIETAKTLDTIVEEDRAREAAEAELEAQRKNKQLLKDEIEEAGTILNNSRKVMDFDPRLLEDAINVGLELSGADRLKRLAGEATLEQNPAFAVPTLPEGWQRTLDSLRPPQKRDEPFWEWRRRAAEPVVFNAPDRMGDSPVHLHLQHPFVQRVLSRFLAQGYSAHDLSRVTIVRNRRDSLVRVIAFGRLSLFGAGATRLHDQLVSVAAQWLENKGGAHLKPFADKADRAAIERLEEVLSESPTLDGIPEAIRSKLLASAPEDFAALWDHIKDEADSRAHEARAKLQARGALEAEALRQILKAQRSLIQSKLGDSKTQLEFQFMESEKAQEEQYKQDRKHWEQRLQAIDREIEEEPEQIEALYQVRLPRLEPVGLVYLWPETRL